MRNVNCNKNLPPSETLPHLALPHIGALLLQALAHLVHGDEAAAVLVDGLEQIAQALHVHLGHRAGQDLEAGRRAGS